MKEIVYRNLSMFEIKRIEEIERAELITHIYHKREGQLVLDEERWDLRRWPPDEIPAIKENLRTCLVEGGAAWGAFAADRLVGMAVLDGRWYGKAGDTLDMYFLHVSDGYRHQGIGKVLFEKARERARRMGAQRLFVSGLPSLNTIRFYQAMGLDIAAEVDPRLSAREPDDIHMDMRI